MEGKNSSIQLQEIGGNCCRCPVLPQQTRLDFIDWIVLKGIFRDDRKSRKRSSFQEMDYALEGCAPLSDKVCYPYLTEIKLLNICIIPMI